MNKFTKWFNALHFHDWSFYNFDKKRICKICNKTQASSYKKKVIGITTVLGHIWITENNRCIMGVDLAKSDERSESYGHITFRYFKKGDYVQTTAGVGKVNSDEEPIEKWEDLETSTMRIQHKFGCSSNPENVVVPVARALIKLITKEVYIEDEAL